MVEGISCLIAGRICVFSSTLFFEINIFVMTETDKCDKIDFRETIGKCSKAVFYFVCILVSC